MLDSRQASRAKINGAQVGHIGGYDHLECFQRFPPLRRRGALLRLLLRAAPRGLRRPGCARYCTRPAVG